MKRAGGFARVFEGDAAIFEVGFDEANKGVSIVTETIVRNEFRRGGLRGSCFQSLDGLSTGGCGHGMSKSERMGRDSMRDREEQSPAEVRVNEFLPENVLGIFEKRVDHKWRQKGVRERRKKPADQSRWL